MFPTSSAPWAARFQSIYKNLIFVTGWRLAVRMAATEVQCPWMHTSSIQQESTTSRTRMWETWQVMRSSFASIGFKTSPSWITTTPWSHAMPLKFPLHLDSMPCATATPLPVLVGIHAWWAATPHRRWGMVRAGVLLRTRLASGSLCRRVVVVRDKGALEKTLGLPDAPGQCRSAWKPSTRIACSSMITWKSAWQTPTKGKALPELAAP